MSDPTTQPAQVEAALMARIAAGEVGLPLEEIYDRYAGRLYGLGLKLLGDPGMAEELVQDTLVRLWRGAERFDPERGSVRTFIFTIARRAAIDLQRRVATRPLKGGGEDNGAALEGLEDRQSLEEYDRVILGLDLRDALSSLPDKQREALELCYDEDLTREAIAERLGVPVGTVKTRIHYALRALRLELRERELL